MTNKLRWLRPHKHCFSTWPSVGDRRSVLPVEITAPAPVVCATQACTEETCVNSTTTREDAKSPATSGRFVKHERRRAQRNWCLVSKHWGASVEAGVSSPGKKSGEYGCKILHSSAFWPENGSQCRLQCVLKHVNNGTPFPRVAARNNPASDSMRCGNNELVLRLGLGYGSGLDLVFKRCIVFAGNAI